MANQLYKGDKPLATFIPQIADNLTTDDSTKALSAKQGKVLNDTKAEIKRTYFNMNSTGQNALYIVTNNEKRIPVGLTITEFDTGYNRAFLSSIGGNVVLNAYKLDGTAYSGNLKGYYYFINDDWT